MIQVYALNQTIAANAIIPFTSVALQKGSTVVLKGTDTIQFNKGGVYEVIFSISGVPSSAGKVDIELLKNGVALPNTHATVPSAVTTAGTFTAMHTLLNIAPNTGCCCGTPSTVSFKNVGVGVGTADVHVTITKIC